MNPDILETTTSTTTTSTTGTDNVVTNNITTTLNEDEILNLSILILLDQIKDLKDEKKIHNTSTARIIYREMNNEFNISLDSVQDHLKKLANKKNNYCEVRTINNHKHYSLTQKGRDYLQNRNSTFESLIASYSKYKKERIYYELDYKILKIISESNNQKLPYNFIINKLSLQGENISNTTLSNHLTKLSNLVSSDLSQLTEEGKKVIKQKKNPLVKIASKPNRIPFSRTNRKNKITFFDASLSYPITPSVSSNTNTYMHRSNINSLLNDNVDVQIRNYTDSNNWNWLQGQNKKTKCATSEQPKQTNTQNIEETTDENLLSDSEMELS